MKQEISPQESNRAEAFSMWMSSPMPMVTLVKTLDVSHLIKVSKRTGMKFTMLMCWCIGRAASQVDEFYTLPVDGKLYCYDKLAIHVIVENGKGGISSCDIPYSDDIQQFNRDYLMQTEQVANECKSTFLEDLAANSDHYPFAQRHVPCIFLENEEGDAFKYYHTIYDDWQHAVFDSYEPVFRLVTDFIERY